MEIVIQAVFHLPESEIRSMNIQKLFQKYKQAEWYEKRQAVIFQNAIVKALGGGE